MPRFYEPVVTTHQQQGPPRPIITSVLRTTSGKNGWKVRLPVDRPLATPAVVDGRVFVGGGFGSHHFYALDAVTGRLLWKYRTADDGPTAAVVADGLVAFNTESCELEVLRVDGSPVWKKWLGDPLMSMPACAAGRLVIAFPDSRGDRRYYVASFDLYTGQEYWRHHVANDVITAPVLAEGCVYFATLGGTLHCLDQTSGHRIWSEQKDATSAPVVVRGRCYFSRHRERAYPSSSRQSPCPATETMSMCDTMVMGTAMDYENTTTRSDWLDHAKRVANSAHEQMNQTMDGTVGFGSSKGDANMEQARSNLGHGTVAGLWAYQGSKVFFSGDRLFSSMGDVVLCVDPGTDKVIWKRSLSPVPGASYRDGLLDSAITPPALVNGKVFVGTIDGELVCLSAHSGDVLWKVGLGEPIVFQPAVAQGRIYAASTTGSVFCLDTGDPADDGWLMWGGNAAHNGLHQDGAVKGRGKRQRSELSV